MRDELPKAIARGCHAGLAYDVYPPAKKKGNEGELDQKLKRIMDLPMPEGYSIAFKRWESALAEMKAKTIRVRARSRLLLGAGYPSSTEVGLTFHRTWGVPVIPGSSLKGLVAAYVQATYGPDPEEREPARDPFRGVQWDKRRIVGAPGEVYKAIFGSPDVDGQEGAAARGGVIFHDALWIPNESARPFGRDVITVHHASYYGGGGPPNDHESPTPVSFLTVRPKSEFLVAWSAVDREDEALAERVKKYIEDALKEWGVGAKTSAGYGRLERAS